MVGRAPGRGRGRRASTASATSAWTARRPRGRSSNQITLPGDQDLPSSRRPVAFELFVPVYQGELTTETSVAERRRRFLGWATGQFRAGDFLDAAMRAAPPFTGVELHDTRVGDDSLVASHPAGFRAGGRYVREDSFDFGGRTFTLRYAPCRATRS